jgi:hypothetical protein
VPLGKPACVARFTNANTERGVSGEGLITIQQPAARAALAFLKIILNPSAVSNQNGREHSRDGEIPWDKGGGNTNRLLDSENPSAWSSWGLYRTRDSLRFTSEPPGES